MENKICCVDDCNNIVYAKGYCSRHYDQLRRGGYIRKRTKYDTNEIIINGWKDSNKNQLDVILLKTIGKLNNKISYNIMSDTEEEILNIEQKILNKK